MSILRRFPRVAVATALVVALAAGASSALAQQAAPITSAELSGFHARSIGPAVTGGRITDVEIHPGHPSTIYIGTASGGIWKSTNRGHQWKPVFDDKATSTFGDVAIAPSNPNVLYAGTGEQNNRQSTSWGNGVYRSDDAGATWRHLGLEGTRHVGRILVHPTNPDVAWVAGLGNLWAEGEERGVFRTRDGGRTWEKVLYVDALTGAVDMAMDPRNPDVLYAAMYQRLRKVWGFNGGGPGSGIFKSTDGGSTWKELTNGLPTGDMGRIGIAVSRSNPDVVMALVEAPNKPTPGQQGGPGGGMGGGRRDVGATGTYRSEDGGATWRKLSDENGRPMYYSHIFIDPNDDKLVYSASTNSVKSTDGGRTWIDISAQPSYDVGVHLDMHAMWLDPQDRNHFYLAGDGGLHETFDGGVSYRKINNFEIGQFYGIGVDLRDPYWIYGGMQDNHSWTGPSETRRYDGILNDDWMEIGFSDGMYQSVDKAGPRYVYSSATQGSYNRVDVIAGTKRPIGPVAPEGEQYRFDWTSPGMASMHQEGLFYMGGNRLFISRDFGETWERTQEMGRGIDVRARALMGVPTGDVYISANDGIGGFGVVSTLSESPLDMKVLWVGTDDGNVQVSRDQGRSWTEVSKNVRGIADEAYVSRVEASAHALGTAYVTFDRHGDGDFAPYVFRTTDFGATWTPLHAGLPEGSVNVIAEHPDNADVLFLGTENAAWVSSDRGATWALLPNVPRTAYDDMLVHPREKDLVMGTHGRSIWILDDTRFLAEWNATTRSAAAHLFSADDGQLLRYRKDNSYRAQAEFSGTNPPDGIELTYRLGAGTGDAFIQVARSDGTVVRRMRVPDGEGVHRVNWNVRHGAAGEPDTWARWDDPDYPRPPQVQGGPMVSPGTYTVTLQARGTTSSTTVRVTGDPLLERADAEYRAAETFLLRVAALEAGVQEAIRTAGTEGAAAARLRTLAREVSVFSRPFGDAGRFYDGNFDAPKAANLARLAELEAALKGAR
ncbi:MAG: WD40/YVTN/BNR-like repeat-containing protein [Longimicrobiales bacterium]